MISIRDLTDEELDEQIDNARLEMDSSEYGSGDYNSAYSELIVAQKEKGRREQIKSLTIRNLKVELTPEEWNRLGEFAEEYCMSRSKLIEYFIRDLTYSRQQGSDEHDIASKWYSRMSCNHELKK